MPYVRVAQDATNGGIRLRYNVHGSGPCKVVFIAGMCVPSTMWIAQVSSLCTSICTHHSGINDGDTEKKNKYSILTLDNRGVGASSTYPTPTSSTTTSTMLWSTFQGYSTLQMAHDVWEVIDAAGWASEEVALIGHSLGGMIAQRMAVIRPQQVRMLGLLATHAGGWWDWFPSWSLMKGIGRMLWNWFDKEVSTHVNLDWHYSERYLEEVVHEDRQQGAVIRRREAYFERYMGITVEDFAEDLEGGSEEREGTDDVGNENNTEKVAVAAENLSMGSFFGHLKAAFGHRLTEGEAALIRGCRRIRTLVMYGSDDGVIANTSSHVLANNLDAHREVKVEGRHFIADESQHEVNKVLVDELDSAFKYVECQCEWCVAQEMEGDVDESESTV